jgi:type II secretory pathway pseudopilin PulG
MSSRATLSIFSVTLASDRLSGIVMSVALTKFTRVAFVLVEILIAVAAIALLVAMTVPAFLRTRKSSQVTQIPNGLRRVDLAVGQLCGLIDR